MSHPLLDRFWSKAEIRGPDECWPWTAGKSHGYGRFWMDGRLRPAHVVAWELRARQSFPAGMDGCHTCDNPGCVNPAHIFPGTAGDNALDSVRKGRHAAAGVRNPRRETCRRGHPMDETNARRFATSNARHCHQCHMDRQRERRAKAGA